MNPRAPDMDAVSAIIREVAEAEVLPRFRTLADNEIMEKAPGDLVTVADLESERALAPRLKGLLPGSRALGEEAVACDPAAMDLIAGDDPLWIIDPVDGTNNFANGRNEFALIVALVVKQETVAGWIHLPLDNETATVAAGAGAWYRGRRMAVVTPDPPLNRLVGTFNLGIYPSGEKRRRAKQARRDLGGYATLRCAGLEYVLMASGGPRHFALFRHLKPWDHAAGVLMHSEAGGYCARAADGAPYRLIDPGEGLLVAPSEACWRAILDHCGRP